MVMLSSSYATQDCINSNDLERDSNALPVKLPVLRQTDYVLLTICYTRSFLRMGFFDSISMGFFDSMFVASLH